MMCNVHRVRSLGRQLGLAIKFNAMVRVRARATVRVRVKVDPDPFQKVQCSFAPLMRFPICFVIKLHEYGDFTSV